MSKDDNMMDIFLGTLFGSKTPVEDAEFKAQKTMIGSQRIPIQANPCSKLDKEQVKEKYKSFGIEIVGESDCLFYETKFPDNIELTATESQFWSVLKIDEKEVARIFYKASFYDRDAFINFNEK